MGMLEKRRFRNLLKFVEAYDENDSRCQQGITPDFTMEAVYHKFGVDGNTQDFTGHALALYRDDR